MAKNSFVLYFQWGELFNLLNDESAGKTIKAIFAFAESGEVPEELEELPPDAKMLFAVVRNQVEKDLMKYQEVCEKRRIAGALGGRNRANNDRKKQEKEPEGTEVKPQKKRFTPPSIEELKSYIEEENLNVNPERFHDFYSSKNWYIGRNKMANWKCAVRNWDRKESEGNNGKTGTGTDESFDRSQYQ